MNKRIKDLRLYLKMNQEEFGGRIEMVKSSVSNIEKGIGAITDRTIRLICLEFGVSEQWLRFGDGEMFIPEKPKYIDILAEEYNLNNMERALVEGFIKLTEVQRQAITALVSNTLINIVDNGKA
ncbi:hypothetical protein AGMMS49975_28560 [Clostridia bacterium]|nr:hypothetical protein AGMMS49975_28560 [Clostridia bacterium]